MLKVVSYWTDAVYGVYAEGLRQSLLVNHLSFDLEAMPDRGGPKINLHEKPRFLLRKLDEHPGYSLLWLDADSVVHSAPHLLEGDPDFDLAACFWHGWFCYSGALFVKDTPAVRVLLRQWVAENEARPAYLDDQNLTSVLLRKPAIRTYALPDSYRWTEGRSDPRIPRSKAVIEHFEIGRSARRDATDRHPR